MTTTEMIELSLENEKALNDGRPRTQEMRIMSNLRNACDVFAQKSFEQIRKIHEKSSFRGFSAEYDKFKDPGDPQHSIHGIKISTFCMAGRIMVTIKNTKNGNSVTLLGGEEKGSNQMAGLHAIDGDPTEALDMLEALTRNWYTFYGRNGKNLFSVDKNLTIG